MVRRCSVCGAAHAACGGPTTVRPVDEMVEARREEGMPLRRYKVGNTVLKLTDEDARRRGLLGQTAEKETTAPAEEPQIVSSRTTATRTSKKA